MREYSYFYNFVTNRISLSKQYDFRNKEKTVADNVTYMLIKTLSMFKYENLPDTIPDRTIELYLQLNGYAGFTEVKGDLYCLYGGLGGEPDANYMPTIFTVANPALKFDANLKIDTDCIIIPNDKMYYGLYPMMCKYATALSENELSLFIADFWARIQALISSADDATKESAMKFLSDVEDGKLGVIGDSEFLEGIKSQPVSAGSSNRNITQLIEYEQYLRAGFFNEIGLNANYNMKRESLNSNESQLNDDMLYPMIDNMLKCRKEGLEKVNAKYGTNITVEFDSSWKDNEVEKDALLENIEEGGSPSDPEETPKEGGTEENETPET